MKKMLCGVAVVLCASSTTGQTRTVPATDVTSATIQSTLKEEIAKKLTDVQIRAVNAGGHNVGVAVVQRPKGAKGNAVSHDRVTEVYQMLEGAGTLVTGGTIVNAQKRTNPSEEITQLTGPSVSGDSVTGGVSRRIAKGDMVIIPAGTPHWWSDIQESVVYTVVRVDPALVMPLK